MGLFDPVGVLLAALGRALTAGVQAMAGWAFSRMIDALLATTRVDLDGWFAAPWRAMLAVGAALALPVLLAGVAGEVLAGRPAQALRRGLLAPIAVGPVLLAARAVLGLALAAVDGLCATVVAAGIGGPAGYARALERMRGLLGVGLGGATGLDGLGGTGTRSTLLVVAVVGLLAFVIWVELAVRAALVYLLVAFVPVALAGLFWSATARWARRLAETLAAVVLAQLVITVVMVLAAAALGSPDGGSPNATGAAGAGTAVDRLAVGLALLLLGSLTLPMTLRVVPPVLEAAAVAGSGAAVSRRLRTSGGELLAATPSPVARLAGAALAGRPMLAAAPPTRPGTGSPPGSGPSAGGGAGAGPSATQRRPAESAGRGGSPPATAEPHGSGPGSTAAERTPRPPAGDRTGRARGR